MNNFDNIYFDVAEYCRPIVFFCTKKIVKRSAAAFWSSNSFLSIKSLAIEDFTVAVGNTVHIISHVALGLSFLVSNKVAKYCFFANVIDLVNLFENLRCFFIFISLQEMRMIHQSSVANKG